MKFAQAFVAFLALFALSFPAAADPSQSADLAVYYSNQSASTVDPGDALSFEFLLVNSGPDASDFTLSNNFPHGNLTATGLSGSGASCDVGTVTCTGTLAPGASITILLDTIVDNLAAPGSELGVQPFVTSPLGIDYSNENDSTYAAAFVNGASSSDVGITVSGPSILQAGETGSFSVDVTNTGPDAASGVSFSFYISAPSGSSFTTPVGPSDWSCSGLTCTGPSLMTVGTAHFTFDITVDASAFIGDSVTTTATLGVGGNDPNTENNGPYVFTTNIYGPATTTTIAAVPSTADVGTPVTLTTTVSSTSGTPNNGTVSFYDGGNFLGSRNVSGGTANLTTSALIAGTHSVTASYTNNAWLYQDSTSAAETVTINKIVTATTLDASPNSGTVGDAVTLTATVVPASGTLTGSVTFYDGSTNLGTVAISGGTATLTTSSLAAGTHTLTATFADFSGTFAESTSNSDTVTLAKIATTTTLDVVPNSGTSGDTVTLTATITAPSGSPTGTVTFYDGSTVLGTSPVSGGTASLSTTGLPVGDRSLSANYSGDASFETSSSSAVTHPVAPISTGTALTSSANPSTVNDTVTFTATVAGATGTPTGTVSFRDGTTVIGTAPLSAGVATFSTSTLTRGSHSITAVYSGDATYSASTSAALAQSVSAIASGTTLASSANPSTLNEAVTFTATVAATGGTPTGTVSFLDGTTVIGTAPLDGGVATFSTSTLTRGTHTISAIYSGDATHGTSTLADLTQTVSAIASGTALTSSANPSVIDKPVTFTATVSGTGGPPTGTVTFRDGTAVLGTATLSNGTATYTTSSLALGTHEIRAIYAGDASFAGSTSSVLAQEITIDTALVEQTFGELTQDFLTERGKLIAQGIDLPSLSDPSNGPSAGICGTSQSPVLNFAIDSRSLSGAGTAAETLALGGAETEPFGIWFDGTFALHQRPDAGGEFAMLGLGADYRVGDSFLAGVALYLDYMTDTTPTGDVVGRGGLVGPYVSAALTDSLYFDASFLAGNSWNDAHATLFGEDFTGSFETTRWMLSSSLSGKLELGELLFRPDVSLSAGSERSDAYTVTGAGTSVDIDAVTVRTLRVSAGSKLSRAFDLGDGLILTPSLGARLGAGSDGAFALSNVFGTLTGGLTLEGEGWKASAEAQVNGDSTGMRSQSVKVGIGGRF